MVILNPKITTPVGGRITEHGMIIGTIDASYFIDKEIQILDYDGHVLFEVKSPFNTDINPCRKKNPLASEFFRAFRYANATSTISDEQYAALISLLILNFSNDADSRDTCTKW